MKRIDPTVGASRFGAATGVHRLRTSPTRRTDGSGLKVCRARCGHHRDWENGNFIGWSPRRRCHGFARTKHSSREWICGAAGGAAGSPHDRRHQHLEDFPGGRRADPFHAEQPTRGDEVTEAERMGNHLGSGVEHMRAADFRACRNASLSFGAVGVGRPRAPVREAAQAHPYGGV